MRMQLFAAAWTMAFAAGVPAMLAAPGQTAQPGQMTQARVWIQNRGRGEAIPINLQEASLDTPLRVRVVNAQQVAGRDEPVNVRVVPQPQVWQYQSVTVTPGQNMAATLSAHGAAGWETTGIALTTAEGTTLLMKRLR